MILRPCMKFTFEDPYVLLILAKLNKNRKYETFS